ncbi:hypothetical protein WOLCODRAFT_155201 [Wolfiporia cocos MD-104 SS10]|uniref:Uncharacterized protein n=1 Tax=Wolfiporia cocos (strain MD-104) TaxID=742152 RepID=A0A2H3JEW7_WOLCO|nr:hypothetical protein WOLCODRAFT_155201 [Wolfiporia cocos MD-104 SS10]
MKTFYLFNLWATPLSAVTLSRFLLDLRLCSVSPESPRIEEQTESDTAYSENQDYSIHLSTFVSTVGTAPKPESQANSSANYEAVSTPGRVCSSHIGKAHVHAEFYLS